MIETRRPQRSLLLHGFRLIVTCPGPILWTYAFNLILAAVFSLKLHAQLSSILDHSLAAERLNSAFDLGTLYTVFHRLSYNAPSAGASNYAGLPLYLLGYFILVPGSIFCYASEAPSRLPILVCTGIAYFWRFVRITLLTIVASLLILGPLLAAQNFLSSYIDDHFVGSSAFLLSTAGFLLIFLVAAAIRLYFDLVEVYAVQLSNRYLADGKADRRIRRTLRPAFRTLRANFDRAYCTFVLLTLLGFAAIAFTGRLALHLLAQPHVWPIFLLAQAGLFAMLATRFWQRAAETILAEDNPLPLPEPGPFDSPSDTLYDHPHPAHPSPTNDPQPDPEPAAPSLAGPDPGVFHHDPPNT